MKRFIPVICLFIVSVSVFGQETMTPELLWKLKRVSGLGVSVDKRFVIYSVSTPDATANKSTSIKYTIPVQGGAPDEITGTLVNLLKDESLSPDGKFKISVKSVKVNKVTGKDFYPEFDKSNVQIYESLNFRHWDSWEDGEFNHLFVHPVNDKEVGEGKDIMPNEPYDCPQQPFGGDEDYTWRPDGKRIVYVAKKKFGTDYAVSTNTDLYEYDVASGVTLNLTEGMMGYDTQPEF
jgi:hypothetical protein